VLPDTLQQLASLQTDLDQCKDDLELAQEVRDEAIVDAFDDGYSLRDIGDAIGLSHTTVRRTIQHFTGVKYLRPK
jgi:transposase-like protein